MDHPWGLSGPQFLWLYGVGLVLALAWAVYRRGRARRPALVEPVRVPGEHALAYLAAGPNRVVETSLARLIDAGAARVSRAGFLVPTKATVTDALDDQVRDTISRNRPQGARAIVTRAATIADVDELRDRLVRQRLLLSPDAERAARHTAPIALYPLLAIGVARWINGVARDLPVDFLGMLLVVTAVALVSLHATHIRTRTVHGDAVLDAATDDRSTGAVELAGIGTVVALGGFVAYPDEEIRRALLFPPAGQDAGVGALSGGGSSSDSSSGGHGCGSSGGSSCGGGGCGGGSS